MPPNGRLRPTVEQLTAIALLARAVGNGSEKLAAAILLVYGDGDTRHRRVQQIDLQLQPLVAGLIADHINPSQLQGGFV